jgi:hypothetical protein
LHCPAHFHHPLSTGFQVSLYPTGQQVISTFCQSVSHSYNISSCFTVPVNHSQVTVIPQPSFSALLASLVPLPTAQACVKKPQLFVLLPPQGNTSYKVNLYIGFIKHHIARVKTGVKVRHIQLHSFLTVALKSNMWPSS